jgi:hypothetical protein
VEENKESTVGIENVNEKFLRKITKVAVKPGTYEQNRNEILLKYRRDEKVCKS